MSNLFLTTARHTVVAVKVGALRTYIGIGRQAQRAVDEMTAVLGDADSVFAAQQFVWAYKPLTDRAQELLNAAQIRMNQAGPGVPTNPPPREVDPTDWRLAWYIDVDELESIIDQLEQQRPGMQWWLEVAAREVVQARIVMGQFPASTPLPQVAPEPAAPQDWNQSSPGVLAPIAGVTMATLRALTALADAVAGVAGAATKSPMLALLAVAAVAVLALLGGRRR